MSALSIPRASLSGSENGAKTLGLSVLTAMSIAGIHSAISPSVFTFRTFSNTKSREDAEITLWISLGATMLASGAVYLVFKNWIPTIVGAATGITLFGIGMWASHSKEGIDMRDGANLAVKTSGGFAGLDVSFAKMPYTIASGYTFAARDGTASELHGVEFVK